MDIKVRAWDSISKKMHPWETVKKHPLSQFQELDHYTLLLCTGIKDKFENYIYEGDKMIINDNEYVVEWSKGGFWMCRMDVEDVRILMMIVEIQGYVSIPVSGNIYESHKNKPQ